MALGISVAIAQCGSTADSPPAELVWNFDGGSVLIHASPFALSVRDASGESVLESAAPAETEDESSGQHAYGAVAFSREEDRSVPVVMYGWDHHRGEPGPWRRAHALERVDTHTDRELALTLAGDGGQRSTLRFSQDGGGLRLSVESAAPSESDDTPNRTSLGFVLHDDDHFFGFGERFVGSDQRGQMLDNWVEDGGFGQGEDVPPSESVPFPSGRSQTNAPIPFFFSTRGFGMLLETTRRARFHMGDETPSAFRVETWDRRFDARLFVSRDPRELIESLTAHTGRPPRVPDWLLGPRRRANIGTDEAQRLRDAKVPTTMIDTALHYFPNGTGDLTHDDLLAITTDLHEQGYKAIAYFNSFVSDAWHPIFDEARDKGYLVKKADGSPFLVLIPPYNAGIVDFTNPEATRWYQSFLRQALDDGWDGWMYDFGEYIPQGAVFSNGMTGHEAHNLYPVLFQRAANEVLEERRPGDYLLFVRSAYAGSGGLVPMLWAGDQNTDFSRSDGLPAALAGALNAGLSGLPLWGSDISGFHYLYNPPPDEELYLRWTELGAFSTDMHDENEGVGEGPNSDRWQIWKSAQSLDVYRRYASLKTRLVPYVRTAVDEARAHGWPVMRHLVFEHPTDARVFGVSDEYYLGADLLVAPVVERGARKRRVVLPAGSFIDFWSGGRFDGPAVFEVDAPLDAIPVFARAGAIVPMLAEDVETLVDAPASPAVSRVERASEVHAWVFAGEGERSLADGTRISVKREATANAAASLDGRPLPEATDLPTWQNCGACMRRVGAKVVEIALAAAGPTARAIAAERVHVTIDAALANPSTTRIVLRVAGD